MNLRIVLYNIVDKVHGAENFYIDSYAHLMFEEGIFIDELVLREHSGFPECSFCVI